MITGGAGFIGSHLCRALLKQGRSLRILDNFSTGKKENLEQLHQLGLTEQQLVMEGTHPALGRVTLAELLATWAVHDLTHIAQISRVMASRYREAVGPWCHPDYLRTLANETSHSVKSH